MRLRVTSALALSACIAAPTAVSAEFDNSIPVRNLTGTAPMVVTQSSVFFPQPSNGKVRVCVSFRNVSGKAASEVQFTFRFDDMLGNPLREAILNRTGSFGPGILIEGKMSELGGNPDSFNNCVTVNGTSLKPRLETIDETGVVFEDGTTWRKGGSFLAAYSRGGTRLANGQIVGTPQGNTGNPGDVAYTPYVPTSGTQPQPYVPQPGYVPQPQYVPPVYVPQPQTPQYDSRPFALVGLRVTNGNAVDRIVPIYAAIGPGFTLQQPVLGQAVGGSGGTEGIFQPAGYVLTGLDVFRGNYKGVDEVLGFKLYWQRMTANGIDASSGIMSNVMASAYPQTYPTKVLRADPGTYISNIIVTPSTHADGQTFVHDISIAVTRL